MEEKNEFLNIVKLCVDIEIEVSNIYIKLSELSKEKSLKQFWTEMSERGKLHINYYKKLLKFSEQITIFQLFSNVNEIQEELKAYKKELKTLSKTDIKSHNQFSIAYQIEYYLLHPIFETLYNFIKTLFPEISKKDSYYNQLKTLHRKSEKLYGKNMELSLIGKCLEEIIRKNRELTYQSLFDQNTGILNIKGFFHNIKHLSVLAMRKKYCVGMLIFDIDRFEKTFKKFSRFEREKIMKILAEHIKSNIRRSDLIGRYGEDKLILYLSDIKEGFLEEFAKKIKSKIESQKYLDKRITTSVGGVQSYITESPLKKTDHLFRSAEEALYLAKSSKENKIIISKIIKT